MSERQLETFARKLAAADRLPKWRRREGRLTGATLLMRRLRFGSEWL